MKPYDRSTDADLLRHSRHDPGAFLEVCKRHTPELANFLSSQLHDDTLAREVLAETLSEAWFARKRFRDPGDGSAARWLFGIARNLVRRTYRNRAIETRGRSRLGLPLAPPDVYAELIDRLDAERRLGSLQGRLESLPLEQREALQLRVVEDLDYSEIASRLAITSEGARTRVFRALHTLRLQMERISP